MSTDLQTGVQAIIDGACERDPEFAKHFQEVMHHASSLPCLQTPPREGDSGALLPPLRMVAPLEDSLGAEAVRQGEQRTGLDAFAPAPEVGQTPATEAVPPLTVTRHSPAAGRQDHGRLAAGRGAR